MPGQSTSLTRRGCPGDAQGVACKGQLQSYSEGLEEPVSAAPNFPGLQREHLPVTRIYLATLPWALPKGTHRLLAHAVSLLLTVLRENTWLFTGLGSRVGNLLRPLRILSHLIYTHTHKLLDIIDVITAIIIIPVLLTQMTWIEILTPVLSSYVFYYKSLKSSVPQFPHMKMRETPMLLWLRLLGPALLQCVLNSAPSTHHLEASSGHPCSLVRAV